MRRIIAVFLSIVVVGLAAWALTALAQSGADTQTLVLVVDEPVDGPDSPAATRPGRGRGSFVERVDGPNVPDATNRVGEAKVFGDKLDQAGTLSVEKLREQYREAQQLLSEVADEVAREIGTAGNVDARGLERLSDRVRAAVGAAFEARQALQQAELVDLERRVEKTKRAVALREQAKQAIIDERTGNLMDEIESGGWRKGQARRDAQEFAPRKDVPRADAMDLSTQERLQSLDVKEAEARFAEAQAAYDRAQSAYDFAFKMHKKGYQTRQALDGSASELKRAELQVERSKLELDALKRQNAAQTYDDRLLTAAVDAPDLEEKLLQLDVEEARLNLSTAQGSYDLHQDANAKQPGSTPMNEMTALAAEVARAKIQVERAQTKLGLHKRQHPSPPPPARATDQERE